MERWVGVLAGGGSVGRTEGAVVRTGATVVRTGITGGAGRGGTVIVRTAGAVAPTPGATVLAAAFLAAAFLAAAFLRVVVTERPAAGFPALAASVLTPVFEAAE